MERPEIVRRKAGPPSDEQIEEKYRQKGRWHCARCEGEKPEIVHVVIRGGGAYVAGARDIHIPFLLCRACKARPGINAELLEQVAANLYALQTDPANN